MIPVLPSVIVLLICRKNHLRKPIRKNIYIYVYVMIIFRTPGEVYKKISDRCRSKFLPLIE